MINYEAINVFGKGIKQDSCDETLLGGKGAKLAEMGMLGLPIPPGVTVTTSQCNSYFNIPEEDRPQYIDSIVNDVLDAYESIANELGYMPLVSVRSGARVSMPGMMDTVLNVGLTIKNFKEWEDRLGFECASDCYRRLIEMYSDVVLNIPAEAFEDCGDDYLAMMNRFYELTDEQFPQSFEEQLAASIEAVFNSWFSDRACAYRAAHGYPDDWGTAVNIQTMVFGNRNDNSMSGVMFTRDFNTGDTKLVIDWLPNAQGEDVVAGTHDPKNGDQLYVEHQEIWSDLAKTAVQIERHYGDMQDIEFTVEDGRLFILQTRSGKRAARAAFRIAYDMVQEGRIDKEEALARVSGREYLALTAPTLDPAYTVPADVTGVPASGHIVTGVAVLSAADAIKCKEPCILVANLTTPEDFAGMQASVGVLTRTGGITSHAAVVARGMNKTCVVGAENLKFAGLAGKRITMDGTTGRIWIDKDVPIIEGQVPAFVQEMLDWAEFADPGMMLEVAPESVCEGGTYYVDVSDRLSTQTALSKALDCLKGASGIISFGDNAPTTDEDQTFLSYFGVDVGDPDVADMAVAEKVLSMGKWNATFKKNWHLHLQNGVSVEYANVLRKHGWKVVTQVNSFKAALNADGYVVLDQAFISQLMRENMEFSEIETLIKQAGRDLKELPERVTENRILFDVLGG